jgi:hypothetical protein
MRCGVSRRADVPFLADQNRTPKGDRAMRRLLVLATAGAVLAAGGVFAGEVKGPPGTINNTNETGALNHAHSACAASGLNDLDQSEGQTVSQVQTAADSWKFYGLPKGTPGQACRGSN